MIFRNVLGIVVTLLIVVSIYLTFFYAPVEMEMGLPQKIFYFHVPSAWVSFLAFSVTFICSIGYLRKRTNNFDVWAISSAEIGLLFCTAAIITGSIWARGSWNTWWDWRESRLTMTLALWSFYAAYLILRTAFEGEQKRINAAVMGIISFIMVPIVFFSIRMWGGDLHPGGFLKPPVFKITEQSLESLKSESVPDDVLEKLQSLKNKEFTGEKKFLGILKKTIGDEKTVRFKSLILKHAKPPPDGFLTDPRMKVAFFTSLFTFTMFYVYLLLLRSDIESLTRQVEDIRRESISEIE